MRNLRCVAIHEYAHLHVARHFGVWGWVSLRPRHDGSFAGQFTAEPLDDVHARRIIGLAGVCAESLDAGRDVTCADMLGLIGRDAMPLSAADAAMAAGFDATHVDECLGILRASWPAIVRDAHGAVELEMREAQREAR